MRIIFHASFKKKYKKLPSAIRKKYDEKLHVFIKNPLDPVLNNHALHGKWKEYRSINVTGDFRAVFEILENIVYFVDINTHSNLYK
ncbi:MAG: hypothetical protein A3C80_03660 [Candidatus Ryanbacteria bacterium RIFCSPHIGHO2_02_FULL_45_43]|uniref:Addiction module toxin RelE n=1 Tax=Candidatus Ryanbacteria bacterium RIFCSPHIGHO2_01_45_13 TaxID=1802112 RepID=A0A1G2FVI4_9BACT|nr:MAG: hypothetical protein A2W41_01685 [Candidatus Ryanbacteria bacterium RIFCSPHIGHO2_01_45_13]OGZ42563.1 MAG: hypothetical protein A2718_02915 [Candidatus Ryanbacteria bacterium RIFCSPHIGHO2_01_FULL_44_130]OGZ47773.1 MAG: hypothetical protein A3C80_03660 [Candidatus Ryanbacteria bacterium RIFCSPHIGHO2_02_FULL_45_43]OGZ49666.1 MAG: hypothetical protein A3E55_02115 [Candidatus Ryanbacteria bacterium RIFCSPHIGHO2_12_FULL_44_20]OGZ52159.1 MAG: hypothetical protein A3A17_02980 [Candidatus Ryanba